MTVAARRAIRSVKRRWRYQGTAPPTEPEEAAPINVSAGQDRFSDVYPALDAAQPQNFEDWRPTHRSPRDGRLMSRDQLEHAIRNACQIIDHPEVIVVGSQAILGSYDESQLPLQRGNRPAGRSHRGRRG